MNLIAAMKPILKISLTFVLMGSLGICSAEAQESNNTVQDPAVQDAIKTLKNSTPTHDLERSVFPDSSSVDGRALLTLYNEQVKAIEVLANAKIPGTAELLLPYLDYRDQQYPRYYIGFSMHENVDAMSNSWPALLALREIPGSSKALSTYILNTKNPLDNRLTAFKILTYVDPKQSKHIGDVLLKEFSSSTVITASVHAILSRENPFLGMIHVKDYGESQ